MVLFNYTEGEEKSSRQIVQVINRAFKLKHGEGEDEFH